MRAFLIVVVISVLIFSSFGLSNALLPKTGIFLIFSVLVCSSTDLFKDLISKTGAFLKIAVVYDLVLSCTDLRKALVTNIRGFLGIGGLSSLVSWVEHSVSIDSRRANVAPFFSSILVCACEVWHPLPL